MSILMDGINNAYSITSQINSLQSLDQSQIENPEALQYTLEQNFNQMLNDLISSTNDDDEEDSDPFSFVTTDYQASLQSLESQGVLENSDVSSVLDNPYLISSLPDTSSSEYLNALYSLGQL